MTLVAIFFVSGADAASIVMGTLSQRGTIHPSKRIVVFWGVMMGSVAALMLVVGGSDALSGIQNITIIMAAPFVLVMIAMCVALYKDLREDPLVRRGQRAEIAIEEAVEFGTQKYGDGFYLRVKPHKDDSAQRRLGILERLQPADGHQGTPSRRRTRGILRLGSPSRRSGLSNEGGPTRRRQRSAAPRPHQPAVPLYRKHSSRPTRRTP